MNSVRLPAYAKVNLCLHTLGRRPDNYHELRTVFQTISLHDTLQLETQRAGRIELHIEGDADLAHEPSRDNLVYRALAAVREELKLRPGIQAVLTKRIPVGRGLGGGSSDAAAAMIGLLRLAGKRARHARLFEIAASLGSDVPFFLHGGRALGIGRGDEIYPLPDVPWQTLVVVSPHDVAVRTPDAYRWLSELQNRGQSRAKGGSPRLTTSPLATTLWPFCALCWSPQGGPLSNDFEAAVFPRYRRLAEIKRQLLQLGATDASLAGSGSAVFAIYQHPATARRIAQAFPKDTVFVCSTIPRVEYRRKLGGPEFA